MRFVQCRYQGGNGNIHAGFSEVRVQPWAQAAVASSLHPATTSAAAGPTGMDWRRNLTHEACIAAAVL